MTEGYKVSLHLSPQIQLQVCLEKQGIETTSSFICMAVKWVVSYLIERASGLAD